MGKSFFRPRVLRLERSGSQIAGVVIEGKNIFGKNIAPPPRVTDLEVDVEMLVHCSSASWNCFL